MMVKGYSAQALAIVMIVLVIAIVIGMAMFSRVLRDSQRTVSEKSSAEALEASDTVLDRIKGVSVSTLKSTCSSVAYGGGLDTTNDCKATGIAQVNSFLNDLGAGGDIANAFSNCQGETSNLDVTVSLADSNDALEMEPDSVRAFVLNGQLPNPAACNLRLTFEPLGTGVAGVQISKIYARTFVNGLPTNYETYGINDVLQYCIFNTGIDCSTNPNFLDGWTPRASGTVIGVSLNRVLVSGTTYKYLDEIRIRAVGGSVSMKYTLSSANCILNNEMIKITTSATCTGSNRAKEVQIPQQDWASSIFDYVIFNSNGALTVQ